MQHHIRLKRLILISDPDRVVVWIWVFHNGDEHAVSGELVIDLPELVTIAGYSVGAGRVSVSSDHLDPGVGTFGDALDENAFVGNTIGREEVIQVIAEDAAPNAHHVIK